MFEGLFQPMHLLVLLGIALLVFGPKKLPELGKGLGDGIRIFKSSIRGDEEESGTSETACRLESSNWSSPLTRSRAWIQIRCA